MTEHLGYRRYGAHGGDWGSTVTEHLARSHAGAVVGIHLTDVPFWHAFQKPTKHRALNLLIAQCAVGKQQLRRIQRVDHSEQSKFRQFQL